LVRRLAGHGVLALDESPWAIRFVTHLDVDDADIEAAVAGVSAALAGG
jgi:threonine aldolase